MPHSDLPSYLDALFIPKDTRVEGPVRTGRSVWLEGTLCGALRSAEDVVITSEGTVRGSIHARSAGIAGVVTGDIVASERLLLEASAFVEGAIQAAHLLVEEGAHFTGDCRMDIPPDSLEELDDHPDSIHEHHAEGGDLPDWLLQ